VASRTPQTPQASLDRIAKGLGDVRDILSDLTERADRSEAKADRANDRISKVEAEQDASSDALKRLAQRTDNGFNEILATQRNSYREFIEQLSALKAQVSDVAKSAEDAKREITAHGPEVVKVAAEGAAVGVVKAQSQTAVTQILKSKTAWLIAFAAGLNTVILSAKNIPGAMLWVGQVIMAFSKWITSAAPGVN
jgi:chromosome segregation ATPase